MKATLPEQNWGKAQKVFFIYTFFFFTLVIFPFPLNIIPKSDVVFGFVNTSWEWLINLAAKYVFGIEETVTDRVTGSGDKLYDWLWYFCVIILTILVGTVFTILDRKRRNYVKLRAWFLFILSYYLAYFMLLYGIIKLFYLQFSPPNLERLFQTFGQASPMRLMWTFMGASQTYTVFAGFSETLAGVLLLNRKTRTLGALIGAGVMLNVFMMNMSYDIPVKLFSFQLMLCGLYIASYDWERIFNLLILNKPASPSKIVPLVTSKKGIYLLLAFQFLFVGYVFYERIDGGIESSKRYGATREKSPLYGVYNVNEFVVNKDTLPPLTTDTTRWERILFDYPSFASVMLMDGNVTRYDTEIDTVDYTIIFSPRGDTVNKYTFNYTRSDTTMNLEGVIEGDTLQVDLEVYELQRFGLLNRGFHWINEVPYNRYNYE